MLRIAKVYEYSLNADQNEGERRAPLLMLNQMHPESKLRLSPQEKGLG